MDALNAHREWKGKLEVKVRSKVSDPQELAVAYTPGVAQPCLEIAKNPADAYVYTRKWNTVAVVSDGSAVLGLGNIGGLAGLPVMEGKAVLFKEFGGVDAIPIVLSTQDTDEIVAAVKAIAPSFGGINLEDISAPRCFEVERRLKEELDIPVFHDDQHGTAVVALCALINALKIVHKRIEDVKIVINGPGAAGTAICKLLHLYGAKNILMIDREGILYKGRPGMNFAKCELAEITNLEGVRGKLPEAIVGADVFLGVSAPGALTKEMVKSMAKDPIIFAMANPTPEIMPDEAKASGARIVATGRSDFPNQINNVVVFPGIFRGALDARVSAITDEMKIAAAEALAALISEEELCEDYVLPGAFDKRVAPAVAEAVKKLAK